MVVELIRKENVSDTSSPSPANSRRSGYQSVSQSGMAKRGRI